MLNRQTVFFLLVSLSMMIFASTVQAAEKGRGKKKNQITVQQKFNKKDVIIERAKGYDLVTLKGQVMPDDEPGTPWMPAAYINVLIPSGATVTNVTATPVDEILLAKGLNIMPAQPQAPLSGPRPEFVKPNAKAYSSKTKKVLFQSSSAQTQRGMSFLPVRVNPVRLVAATGELYLAQKVNITISFKQNKGRRRASKRHFKKFRDSVLRRVVNPTAEDAEPILTTAMTTEITQSTIESETAADDGVAAPLAAGPCDYLVITSSALANDFAALCNHRQSFNGYSTQIVTVETIEATYPGIDTQEKIRNCIIDYVNNQGTLYVVLGGDNSVVAVRQCYVYAAGYTETKMPTDLYYAGLDGNWDDDGDRIYGEARGDAGSEGDLAADVLVGRIPIRTSEQATAYINKVINFETNPRLDILEKFIMSGKELWSTYKGDSRPTDAVFDGHLAFNDDAHPSVSDAEIWMRRMFRDDLQANGYSPMQVGAMFDTLTSWDGATAGSYAANPVNMAERFSEGWNIVANYTHGGYGVLSAESGVFTTEEASTITAPTNFFYTGACLSGGFDKADPSMSEAMLRNPNGGALVYIGCSRYNFGGTADDLMGRFFQRVFMDNMTNTGEAFYAHKAGLFASFDGVNRWVTFGINLQGDPGLTIVTSAGGQNIPPIVKNTSVEADYNTPVEIAVTASDMEGSPITYSIVQAPQNGTLTGTLPNVTYTPNTDYFGADSLVWEASDGTVSSQATVSINVLPFNNSPVIDSMYADPDVITLPTHQTQLYAMASDVEENPLSYQWELFSGPAVVSIETPDADNTAVLFNEPGTYTFLVTVSDGRSSVIDTVSVVVNPATGDDLVSSLVLHYKLDEDTGTVAKDSSILGYNGTLYKGPVWRPTGGVINGSLLFDGVDDYVLVPDKDLINGDIEKRTIALWFMVTDATVNTHKQVLYQQGASLRGMNMYVFDGKLYFGGWNAVSTESDWSGTFLSTPISSGVWHHATLVIDGTPELTADAMKVYLDGALVGTGAGSKVWGHKKGTLGCTEGGTLFDTGFESDTGHYLDGQLDEVRVYNRALNATEIASLANAEVPVNTPPVIVSVAANPSAITLPVETTTIMVVATDADADNLTTLWSKQSGLGTVIFANENLMSTTATFSEAGTYVLLVQVSDGKETVESTLTVTVSDSAVNTPPVISSVTATPSEITLPVDTTSVAVVATDADDDNLTAFWSKQSGAGTVTFADASLMSTNATFSEAGTYVLKVQVSDGEATVEDTVTVTVSEDAANTPPAITSVTATPNAITLPVDTTAVAVVATDADDDNLTALWSKQSGAGTVTFADASLMSTNATFSEAGTYVLKVQISDGEATVESTVTVTVNPALDPVNKIAINFQPEASAVPEGCLVDSAKSYDTYDTYSYGWTEGVGATRERNADADQRKDTLVHMQTATWEIAIPNGTYNVTLFAGDPSFVGAINSFNLEGVVLTDPDGADNFDEYTTTVTVTDGRLTLAPGADAVNPKVNYIEITADIENAPPVITSVTATPNVITLPVDTTAVAVVATDADDDDLITVWSKQSGAGTVTFADASLMSTNATFSEAGTYVLLVQVSDGTDTVESTVTVTVNTPPVISSVTATPNAITLPVDTTAVAVVATDADSDNLTTVWSKQSGTGTVTFADASLMNTTATFSEAGTYVLLVQVSDGTATVESTVTVTVSPESGVDLTTDLVLHYKFDEASGTVAADSSVSAKDGTVLNGAVWNVDGGVVNGALNFDGVNDSVTVPDYDVIDGVVTKRSVSIWFKVDDASITTRKQVVYAEGGSMRGLNIYVYDGNLYFGGWNTAESGWAGTFLSTPVTAGTWVHAVLVLDGGTTVTSNAMKAYVNGTLVGSGEGSQIWAHNPEVIGNCYQTLYHTGVQRSSEDYLAGSADDLRIYNCVLSQEQITALSAMGQ